MSADSDRVRFVYVTFPHDLDLATFAREALASRLCACVNVLTSRSIYEWEGEVKDEPEQVALFKTSVSKLPALRAWLERNHPHDCACLATLEPTLNGPFAAWVEETTGATLRPIE